MKTNTFFTAALAATVMFAACNKDDGDTHKNTIDEPAKMSISIRSKGLSRTITDTEPTTTFDNLINNYTVFITDQNDEINTAWSAYSESSADITDHEVTTMAKHVYVVANGGDLTDDISSMANLMSYLADLNDANYPQAFVSGTSGPWATGVTNNPLSFTNSDTEWEAEAEVSLTFIAARIVLKISHSGDDMNGYSTNATDQDLNLTGVSVLNARGESKLFPAASQTSLIPDSYTTDKKWYQGLANSGYAYYPATGFSPLTTLLSDNDVSLNNSTGNFDNYYYYYVFENDADTAEEFPTIITITGTFKGEPVFFPVHLAHYEFSDLDGGIKRGNSYNITVNLTGNPKADGDGPGGTDDPTKPIKNAKVDITVTAATWNPVSLSKEF